MPRRAPQCTTFSYREDPTPYSHLSILEQQQSNWGLNEGMNLIWSEANTTRTTLT